MIFPAYPNRIRGGDDAEQGRSYHTGIKIPAGDERRGMQNMAMRALLPGGSPRRYAAGSEIMTCADR